MKNYRFIFLVLIAVFVISLPAFAVERQSSGVGACIIPLNNEKIQMVSQKVYLRVIENDTLSPTFVRNILIDAEYEFYNPGKETTVEMGLPYPRYAEKDKGYSRPWNFEVIVGKKAVDFDERDISIDKFRTFYTWKASIPQNRTVKVILRYRISASLDKDNGTQDPCFNSAYIMETGKFWQGTIEATEIVADYSPVYVDLYKASPGNYETRYGQLAWKWKDYTPLETISFQIWPNNILSGFYGNVSGRRNREILNASSVKDPAADYSPALAFDGNPQTCWAPEKAGGKGSWISIQLPPGNERSGEKLFHIEKIGILNGNFTLDTNFEDYARAKDVTLEFSDGTRRDITLEDMKEVQWFKLTPPVGTMEVKMIINSAYSGKKHPEPCISEIMLRGTYFPGK